MFQVLIAGLVLGAPAPGGNETAVPGGPVPQIAVVRLNKNGELVQRVQVPVTVQKETVTKIVVGGQEVIEKRRYNSVEFRVEEQTLQVKGLRAFDAVGKEIPAEKFPELLKKDTLVLISADGNKLDPAYLRIIKEGSLILVLPPGQPADFPPLPPLPLSKEPPERFKERR